jgi:hypothetical protein
VLYIAEKKLGEQALRTNTQRWTSPSVIPFVKILGNPLTRSSGLLSLDLWLSPGFEHIVPEPDYSAFSTNGFVYQLTTSTTLRDTGHARRRAHPHRGPAPAEGRPPQTRTHCLAAPKRMSRRDYVHISRNGLALRGRLVDPSRAPVWPSTRAVDLVPVENAFGNWDRAWVVHKVEEDGTGCDR